MHCKIILLLIFSALAVIHASSHQTSLHRGHSRGRGGGRGLPPLGMSRQLTVAQALAIDPKTIEHYKAMENAHLRFFYVLDDRVLSYMHELYTASDIYTLEESFIAFWMPNLEHLMDSITALLDAIKQYNSAHAGLLAYDPSNLVEGIHFLLNVYIPRMTFYTPLYYNSFEYNAYVSVDAFSSMNPMHSALLKSITAFRQFFVQVSTIDASVADAEVSSACTRNLFILDEMKRSQLVVMDRVKSFRANVYVKAYLADEPHPDTMHPPGIFTLEMLRRASEDLSGLYERASAFSRMRELMVEVHPPIADLLLRNPLERIRAVIEDYKSSYAAFYSAVFSLRKLTYESPTEGHEFISRSLALVYQIYPAAQQMIQAKAEYNKMDVFLPKISSPETRKVLYQVCVEFLPSFLYYFPKVGDSILIPDVWIEDTSPHYEYALYRFRSLFFGATDLWVNLDMGYEIYAETLRMIGESIPGIEPDAMLSSAHEAEGERDAVLANPLQLVVIPYFEAWHRKFHHPDVILPKVEYSTLVELHRELIHGATPRIPTSHRGDFVMVGLNLPPIVEPKSNYYPIEEHASVPHRSRGTGIAMRGSRRLVRHNGGDSTGRPPKVPHR